ncbi:MAG TPA: AAA family ATPase [Pirellulales bacterium]
MSTTDQAFIRAYQQEIAPSNSLPPLGISQRQSMPQSPKSPQPLPAPANSGNQIALPESASKGGPDNQAEPTQHVQWRIIDQVDIGLGSVVPTPHANFRLAHGSVAETIGTTPPSTSSHQAESQPHPAHSPNAASLRAKLQRSPKASLSTFAKPIVAAATAAATLQPALEIDAISWPPICELLLAKYGDHFDRLARELKFEAEAGKQAIAIAGLERGEGRTTLALCVARRLATQAVKVALVEADFAAPQLAEHLGIAIEQGWESALVDDAPIDDILIDSLRDGFTIVPLGRAAKQVLRDFIQPQMMPRLKSFFDQLKSHYDLVLIDAGLESSHAGSLLLHDSSLGVDAVIVSHRSRPETARRLAAVCLQLAEAGTPQLGIAELQVVENALA